MTQGTQMQTSSQILVEGLNRWIGAGVNWLEDFFPGLKPVRVTQQVMNRSFRVKDEKGKDIYPEIIEHERTKNGHLFKLKLPPGYCTDDVVKVRKDIEFALNADVTIWEDNGFVRMKAVTGRLPNEILYRKHLALRLRKYRLAIPVGHCRAGWLMLPLKGTTAHVLGGGITGAGKSGFLRQVIVSLHEAYTREELSLWLADLKGGNEFKLFKNGRLVEQYVNSVDKTKNMLKKLDAELDRRMEILEATPWVDIDEFNEKETQKINGVEKIPSILLIIDELGEINDKEDVKTLQRIIKLGRALNIHIIAFLQRACSQEMSSVLKSQFGATIVGRVKNSVNSRIFLDDENDASNISVDTPGRFVFATTKITDVQVPWLSTDKARNIMKEYQKLSTTLPKKQSTNQLTILPKPTLPN